VLKSIFTSLLPGFSVTRVSIGTDDVSIHASTIQSSVPCPDCQVLSWSTHSYYFRTPHDLAIGDFGVRLNLTLRRMKCLNHTCPRKTFVERMPDFLPLHAQRTLRQTRFLKQLVFEVNATAAARICQRQRIRVSADTLNRIAYRTDLPQFPEPRIIGIDDWAKRKGVDYGTLIVDLERHRPIALLPNRTTECVKEWLLAHPTVDMVCRDRYSDYIEAIHQGAPAAVQITDRWHLLRNQSEAVQRVFAGYGQELQDVANRLANEQIHEEPTKQPEPPISSGKAYSPQRSAREKLLQDVKRLARAGYSNRQISKMLPVHRETVARYREADRVPVKGGMKPYTAAAYEPQVLQLWEEGNHSPKKIYLEIKKMGYQGSLSSLYRLLLHLGMNTGSPQERLQPRRLTARQAAWILTAPEQKLNEYQKRSRELLCDLYPEIAQISLLANRFVQMVKERKADELKAWIDQVKKSSVPKLKTFAAGLEADFLAVHAALSHEWSNGQLEGQINRLKVIKRMMYGRAGFDLLRNRVLYH